MLAEDRFGAPSSFKRRQFEAPHRRQRLAWRLFKSLLGALLLVGVPVGTACWTLYHPSFELRTLSVAGTGRVAAEWVEERLQPLVGRPLLLVRLAEVEILLNDHPWIGGLEVRREMPRSLRIEVTERVPVAILTVAGSTVWVDAAGRSIAAFDPETGPSDLLRIVAPAISAPEVLTVLAAAREASRLQGLWGHAVDRIEVSAVGDLKLHSRELPFPLLVRPDGLEVGLRRLTEYMDEIVRRYPDAGAVDVRFVNRIVIQNAAPKSSRKG